MKSVIVALVLSAAVMVGSTAYTSKIDIVTKKMQDINSEITIYLENNDFINARKKTEEMKDCIEKHTSLLETMGNHEETDKIAINLSELERFIAGEKCTDALAKCGVLGFLTEHMREAAHLTIENIL